MQKTKSRKIPDRKCDKTLSMKWFSETHKLPVWIQEDHFVVVCELTDRSEVVYAVAAKFDKKMQKEACEAIRKAIAELNKPNLGIAAVQKEFYYEPLQYEDAVG